MILISIKDLIQIAPDLINLFLSGFIFVRTYMWLNNMKIDSGTVTVLSVFISFIIKAICSFTHALIMPHIMILEPVKILVLSAAGFILAVMAFWIKQTPVVSKILYKISYKTIHDDVFDDMIDYDTTTTMSVYLKSSDVYYIGIFAYREEKGNDSWFVLKSYDVVSCDTNQVLFSSDKNGIHSAVAINLSNVDRIEISYAEDSKAWEKMNQE